jgi:hypothetical protein
MSDTRRKLSNLLAVAIGTLLAVAVVVVLLLSFGDQLRPLLSRFISESEPTAGPPPEAFERFRREQDDIAHGEDRGPIRCSLSRWTDKGQHPADLKLSLTNTSSEPVSLWYTTWPHCHVTFVVRDEDGKAVASFHWGTLSSQAVSVDQQGKLVTSLPTLKPGETYTAGIWLSTLSDCCHPRPERLGLYRVEAVFVYSDLGSWPQSDQDFVARSGTVEVEVGEPQPGDKFRAWRLR